MIKPGSLVRLNPSLTSRFIEYSDAIGLVVKTDYVFYVAGSGDRQDRHHVLWGNEQITFEPTAALIEISNEEKV